jgi:four helix bundle protein
MPEASGRRDIQDRAFRFACRLVAACERLIRRGGVAARIGRQLAAAGTSIGANLEEASGAQSRPDFIAKVGIALKEARETRYWLRLVIATQQPVPADAIALGRESDELVAILTVILRNARSKRAESAGDEPEGRS